MTEPFEPGSGHRLHPQLAALVRAAQRQPEPPVSVRFEDVQRAASRRWQRGAVALALAAGLAGLFVWAMREGDPGSTASRGEVTEVARAQLLDEPGPFVPDAQPPTARPEPNPTTVALTGEARLEVLEQDAGLVVPEVVDGLPTLLSPGRYSIRTGADALELPLGARVLEIQAASEVVVDVGAEHVRFEVVHGRASWQRAENADEPAAKAKGPSAKQLQAQAESALIRGDRTEAIATLRTLVRKHPRSAASKAGLIDLARLEKAAGRMGRARCAYALFLERFPADARAPSVRTAAEPLGPAQCRGLEPRSR